jgi:hypothetical protein
MLKIVKLINLTLSHFQIIIRNRICIFAKKFTAMSKQVRVFCTKSNWTLHIGGVRTALFNYLFAKKTMVF